MLSIWISTNPRMGARNALVIQKCVVLFWVEHFEKCACWITVDATSDLVHLID